MKCISFYSQGLSLISIFLFIFGSLIFVTPFNFSKSCQNTLYYLKFRGSVECRYSSCPDQCMRISNEWKNERNTYYGFFRENQINICETCFRAGYCHINDCLNEKALINDAIDNALKSISLHYLNENNNAFQQINVKTSDYYNNMEYIFRSFDKIEKVLKKFENLYKNSVKIKLFYKKAISFISKKHNITLSDFNLGIEIDLDEEISIKSYIIESRKVKDLYELIKKDIIHFNDNQVYISNEIYHDQDVLKKLFELNSKVKSLVERSEKLKSKLKGNILKNLQNTDKLISILNTLNSKKGKNSKINTLKVYKKENKLSNVAVTVEKGKSLEEKKSSVSNIDNSLLKENLKKNIQKEQKILSKAEEKINRKKYRKKSSKKNNIKKDKNKSRKDKKNKDSGSKTNVKLKKESNDKKKDKDFLITKDKDNKKEGKSKKAKKAEKSKVNKKSILNEDKEGEEDEEHKEGKKSKDKLVKKIRNKDKSKEKLMLLPFRKNSLNTPNKEDQILNEKTKYKQENEEALERLLKTYFENKKSKFNGKKKTSKDSAQVIKGKQYITNNKKTVSKKEKDLNEKGKNIFILNKINKQSVKEFKTRSKRSSSSKEKLKTQQIFTETKNTVKRAKKDNLLEFNDEDILDNKGQKKKKKSEGSPLKFEIKNSKTINKKNLKEIKNSVKNFMNKLSKRLQDEDKPIFKTTNIKSSVQMALAKGIKKESKVNNNHVKKLEEKMKSLDQEFFKIKNKIILSLLN